MSDNSINNSGNTSELKMKDELFTLIYGKTREEYELERKKNSEMMGSIISKYESVKDDTKYPHSNMFDVCNLFKK